MRMVDWIYLCGFVGVSIYGTLAGDSWGHGAVAGVGAAMLGVWAAEKLTR